MALSLGGELELASLRRLGAGIIVITLVLVLARSLALGTSLGFGLAWAVGRLRRTEDLLTVTVSEER